VSAFPPPEPRPAAAGAPGGPPKSRTPRIAPPRWPVAPAPGALPSVGLTERERLAGLRLTDALAAAPGRRAVGVTIEACHLIRVGLAGAILTGVRVEDTRLETCDLANADLYKADLLRVEWRDCRLTGLAANEARIEHAVFAGCHAHLAQFRFARFKHARFVDCNLHEADFAGSDLSGVAFANCDLRSADFSGATLTGADLRGSKLEGVKAGAAELRGAIVTPLQAVELLRQFGVVVRWEEED